MYLFFRVKSKASGLSFFFLGCFCFWYLKDFRLQGYLDERWNILEIPKPSPVAFKFIFKTVMTWPRWVLTFTDKCINIYINKFNITFWENADQSAQKH